ncbi:MAG: response regulator transcription factor [Candidatus Eisenbacteria bacterium]
MPVVVVEDDPRYRESLGTLLEHAADFTLTASFSSAVEALPRFQQGLWPKEGPKLVLMDIDLPGIRGTEATRLLKRDWPDLLIVMLTVFEEPRDILDAICAGADGYLLKRTPPRELLDQLLVVVDGGAPLTSGVARTVLDLLRGPRGLSAPATDIDLTDRERDVLRCLVEGLAYKQTAAALGVSIDTVRTHIRGLYKKLQVHSVAEAVSRALREGLA